MDGYDLTIRHHEGTILGWAASRLFGDTADEAVDISGIPGNRNAGNKKVGFPGIMNR